MLSDTHTALPEDTIDLTADLIVHVGDFGNAGNYFADVYFKYCKQHNKEFIFVLGNHDYWHSHIDETVKYFKDLGANILYGSNEIKWKGYTFIGGTFWSNFRANKLQYDDPLLFDRYKNDCRALIDFTRIGSNQHNGFVTPEEYVTLNNSEWNHYQQYKNRDDVIVLTHFPPSLACIDPYCSTHPQGQVFNPYFINDRNLKGFKLVLAGHTHTAVDTVIDGCRVVINPYGHANEQLKGNGYRDKFCIELENREM